MAQAKAKSNSVVTTVWENTILSISVLGAGVVMFDRAKASDANRQAAENHGWVQRLCDRAAIGAPVRAAGTSEHDWLGQLAAHKQAKFAAIQELASYYESGDVAWKMTGTGERDAGLFFTALCEFRSKVSPEKLAAHVKSLDKDGLAALKAVPGIVDIMNRLRKERVAKVDTGAALGALDALSEEEGDELAE